MKILVTGGAGFIGSSLVDRLILENHQVVIIDDLSSGKEDYLNPQAKFYQLDIASPEIFQVFATEKFDLVYHLAAQIDVRRSVSDPIFDNQVNVLGGLNILQACHQHQVKKIIFSSTGGAIYGEAEEIPTTEYAPTYPVSPYGIHKLTFEKYLAYYYQEHGLNYAILRFANVYGPRQFKGGEAGVIAIFTDQAVADKECTIFGDGEQTRDFVYVDDVVAALVKPLSIDCRGEINVGTGQESTLWQVVAALEAALGRKVSTQLAPAKPGEQRRSVLSIKRANEVFNWQPQVDLMTGVKQTVAWAKQVHHL